MLGRALRQRIGRDLVARHHGFVHCGVIHGGLIGIGLVEQSLKVADLDRLVRAVGILYQRIYLYSRPVVLPLTPVIATTTNLLILHLQLTQLAALLPRQLVVHYLSHPIVVRYLRSCLIVDIVVLLQQPLESLVALYVILF